MSSPEQKPAGLSATPVRMGGARKFIRMQGRVIWMNRQPKKSREEKVLAVRHF
jgi:hypothetical protein